jgi:hypothetical protein
LPAVHSLAEDGGALGPGKNVLLPGGSASPSPLEFSKIASNDAALDPQLVGHLLVGQSFAIEALDLGAEPR